MTNNTTADLDRDIAHLIDSSENGIASVPRETLVRLRALLTSPRAEVPREQFRDLLRAALKRYRGENPSRYLNDDQVDAQDAEFASTLADHHAQLTMLDAAPAAPVAEPVCATCNGHGMIGGPSFYAPDEGGVPCPDCAQAVAADGAALTEAVTRTVDTIKRQLDLIIERAPGNFLDKMPVVRSLTAHKNRLEKALAITEPRAAVSPATADERAAFVSLIGYERPETEGCAVDVWDSHRATWSAAIEFARAQAAAPAAVEMTWNEVHALNDAVKMMPSHGSLRTFRDRLFAASPDRPGLAAAPASPDWRHIANEWADVATNGIQAVKNVRDGVDTAEEAIARLKADIERCRELPPQAAAPAEAREITMTVEDAMRIVMANWGDKDAIERVFRANVAPADARHSDDIAVDAFAVEMKAKMAAARAKGRSGWETCAPEDLSRMLREHVEKGDPRDVANFCMMLHHHGASISGAADAGEAVASIANPLTPYGMLVRALRIVAGTTLMEMATGMGVSPAFLSSLEFGRRPVTYDNAAFASGFFSDNGVVDTLPALAHAVGLSQGAQGGKGGEA